MKKHYSRAKLFALTLLMPVSVWAENEQQKIFLQDQDLSQIYQAFGIPMKNRAVTGEPLTVAGKHFSSGIGVQAGCVMQIQLHKKAIQLDCSIGLNDLSINYADKKLTKIPLTDGRMTYYQEEKGQKQYVGIAGQQGTVTSGDVTFIIEGDGKILFTKRLQTGDRAVKVSIPLSGVEVLQLRVEKEGSASGDHANWMNASISYFEIKPAIVAPDYQGDVVGMNERTRLQLQHKIAQLPKTSLLIEKTNQDWLIDDQFAKTKLFSANQGKDLVFSNGLVSRVFRIYPNLATVDIQNFMTGENLLRAVSNEGTLTLDGREYSLGGLDGQPEFGYTQYHWIDDMIPLANSFRVTDFEIKPIQPRIQWANSRWALEKKWSATGKQLTFVLEGPNTLKDIQVKLHYALYDGMPVISKWMEVINKGENTVLVDSFKLEQLAMAEPESPVETQLSHEFLKPNIHVESDWGFHGFVEKSADNTEFWCKDPRYTSQCNYPLLTPCLLEVKLPMGPNQLLSKGDTLKSFRNWMMPYDSNDRERKGLFRRRMYRKIAPWVTENPIFMHCTSSEPSIVKLAIDQAAETGYEMVILSFGSGLNMEDESTANLEKFRKLREYATEKGIELGGYSLLSSRWISDEVDVINPQTGKRGGMIFGSSPCLSSDWGHAYFRKIKNFYEKTGMKVFENDGSYPGNVCASESHAHHKGLEDSQWEQRKMIAALYQWMCEQGIYMNIPDYGYLLNGSNKVGIGYREVNWSLPRERQLVLGRQVMYDGLWDRLPSMCWTFVPLTQYHGGGEAATLEPLSQHLTDYKAHMMQNYGSGVQACYRGHRLYDTEETKVVVKEVVDWYKQYRDILNCETIHLRRPDGKDWDGIMHISPSLKERALVMLYNPTDEKINRTIKLPLYYTGLKKKAHIREQEGKRKRIKLDNLQQATVKVSIPARGYTWLVVE